MTLRFAPDALPGIPGVIASGDGLRPSGRGYANWKNLRQYGGANGWTVPAAPNMLWSNDFETYGRVLAGTATAIYELDLTGYATFDEDVVLSGMTPPSYPSGQTEQNDPANWVFANYGQVVLATNKFVGSIYAQTTRGATFAAVSGSPAAGCMVVWKNYIIVGNTGTYGAVTGTQDMVAWSALSNYQSWVPAGTAPGNQRLLDSPGRIVHMQPIGDALAIYKADAIYLMWEVGTDTNQFAFHLVDGDRGCNAKPDYPPPVVDIGKAHFIVGRDDVYLFDGAQMKSIAEERVRRYMLNLRSSGGGILQGTHITHDPFLSYVILWNYGLVYDYKHDQWGTMPASYIAAPVTAANYASAWHVDLGAGKGIINNAKTLFAKQSGVVYSYWYSFYDSVTTTYADMVFNFAAMGANDFSTTLRRLFMVFSDANPTLTPTLSYSRKVSLGSSATADGAGTWDSTKAAFDIMKDAYWHVLSLTITSTEEEEVVGMEFDLARDGKRVESGLRRL